MENNCTETLNKLIKPSCDVKEQLSSLISLNEQQILALKKIIFFDEANELLSSFSSHGKRFVTETTNVQQQLSKLEPNIVTSLQNGRSLAQKIIPILLQERSLQASLSIAEREEAVARYRSEVVAAEVLGSLEMALSSFSNLSLQLGTHVSSSLPMIRPLPSFYHIILERFSLKFQKTLCKMEVPKIRPATNWTENRADHLGDRCCWDEDTLKTFRCLYQTLSDIKLPELTAETDAAKRCKLSIPMRLILEPLEKRFLFNFYGNRITNKPEKPEWYFTEVLTWISINDQWLTWMQDEQLKDSSKPSSNLRMDFMQGLVSFLVDKISFDLGLLSCPPKPRCPIQYREAELTKGKDGTSVSSTWALSTSPPAYFGHLTDEMLNFETCLDGLYYHPLALRPADLFTHRLDVLHHWITLEFELAHRKLKDILAKPCAWRVEKKVPQCVSDFVALVYSISRRTTRLQHKAAKSRVFFFKVLLDLVFTFLEVMINALPWNASADITFNGAGEEFHDRLTRWTSILNAIQVVLETMQEWTNDQYFVELWEDPESHQLLTCSWDPWMDEATGTEDVQGWNTITGRLEAALMEESLGESKAAAETRRQRQCPGVFSMVFELYRRRLEQSLQHVEHSLFGHLRELAQTYISDSEQWSRVDSWDTAPVPQATSLSGHATELFFRLNCDLLATSKTLLPCLFTKLWQPILTKIDQLFYKKLVLGNRFTAVGASQLHYDLCHCLSSLLMPYSKLLPVDNLLSDCFDACRLLNLPPGSIHLLQQSLISAETSSAVLGSLIELGIRRLTPEEVSTVLSRYICSTASRDDGDGDVF